MTTTETIHPFELAGLGKAPFRFEGVRENVYIACQGAEPQPGGSCDYCCNGIRYEYWVSGADGARFKVGCDCIARLYKESKIIADPVKRAVDEHRRKLARDIRHAREKAQLADMRARLAPHRARMESLPHSRDWAAAKGQTMANEYDWWDCHAGRRGKLEFLRSAVERLGV